MAQIDLVADVGESFGNYQMHNDDDLIRVLTSANVACGFHAGDPRVMFKTVERCAANNVAIGAHPGFPDLVGFGRRDMNLTEHEVFTDTLYQIGALDAFVRAHGLTLQHVCPHGRLGNLIQVDATYAKAVVNAIEKYAPNLIVLGLGGEILEQARGRGLKTAQLAVVDRGYESDGRLVSRTRKDALLHDPDRIAARTVRLVRDGLIDSIDGQDVAIAADTVLLHGDNQHAVQIARAVHKALSEEGIGLASMSDVIAARSR